MEARLSRHLRCWTLTLGLNLYWLMEQGLGPGPGFYRIFSHEGFRLRRTPRPLYWKAKVMRGVGRGSRDLVS